MKSKHILAVKVSFFPLLRKFKQCILQHFDEFLKQHRLSVCENSNVLKKDQYWRSLTLRSNEQNELMMTVVVHPQSLSKVIRKIHSFCISH